MLRHTVGTYQRMTETEKRGGGGGGGGEGKQSSAFTKVQLKH